MALTHVTVPGVNEPGVAFDPTPTRLPAAPQYSPRASPQASPMSYGALAALPRLHAEAGANLQLTLFLARSAPACVILMLSGMALLAVTSASGGVSLKAGFAWAALLLLGITAMTRNYIRGFARSLRRVPLHEAASDLRMLLLYSGMVWSSGAFLVMPDLPAPALILAFALLPSMAMALCLRDARGVAYFILPITTATAGATILGAWPLDVLLAPTILAAGLLMTGLPALQQANVKKTQALTH